MFRAYVTNLHAYNCGHLIGKWVTFPIDEDKVDEMLHSIGVCPTMYSDPDDLDECPKELIQKDLVAEEYFITDYDYDPDELAYMPDLGEYISIEELNGIAESLEELSENLDLDKFCAYCEAQHSPTSMEDFEEIVDELDDYNLYPEIENEDDLGTYLVDEGIVYVPDELYCYIDFEKVGRENSWNSTFTSLGFLTQEF